MMGFTLDNRTVKERQREGNAALLGNKNWKLYSMDTPSCSFFGAAGCYLLCVYRASYNKTLIPDWELCNPNSNNKQLLHVRMMYD